MNISSLCISRPVLATVLSILIVLFGGIGFFFLGVREYPNVDPPIISVSTAYTGANADVIESQITEPLEEEINGISGIRSLTSTSRDGRSSIRVEFELGWTWRRRPTTSGTACRAPWGACPKMWTRRSCRRRTPTRRRSSR